MSQLPSARTEICRPFTNVGVDFTGYFEVKYIAHRSTKISKSYAAFFVCMSTTAVHIEVVSELTTEKFLESLRGLISRRGLLTKIFSDNAKNFVGSNNLLNCEKIRQWNVWRGIQWQYYYSESVSSRRNLGVRNKVRKITHAENYSTCKIIIRRIADCVLSSRSNIKFTAFNI